MDKFAAVATSEHDDACFVLRAETSGSPLVSMPLTLPVPVTGELLLTVEYSDVNPVDYQKLHGSRGFPLIPGFGGAGRVRTVPVADQLTSAFSPGDRVAFLASPSGGSFASHALVSSQLCCRLPDVLPLAIAAALPVAGVTAYEALFDRLELPRFRSPNIWGDDDGDDDAAAVVAVVHDESYAPAPGITFEPEEEEATDVARVLQPPSSPHAPTLPAATSPPTLLVIGGAGGVGSFAIGLARRLSPQIHIIATASTTASQDRCRSLGAHTVLSAHDGLAAALGGGPRGATAHDIRWVLNLGKPSNLGDISEVVSPFARVCLVVSGGSAIQSCDLSFLFFKACTVVCETVFSRARNGIDVHRQTGMLEHLVAISSVSESDDPFLLQSTLAVGECAAGEGSVEASANRVVAAMGQRTRECPGKTVLRLSKYVSK